MKENINTLTEINQDEVRRLKNLGMVEDAKNLLQAHYRNIKLAKRDAFHDIMRHRRLILKSKGYCVCGRKAKKGVLCLICYKCKISSYYKKNWKDRCICGNTKRVKSFNCVSCAAKKRVITYNKNVFYNKVELIRMEKGKIYSSKEFVNMLGFSSYNFYVFIKKLIKMNIIKRVKKNNYIIN